jgi:hypothetical protein
MGNSNSSNRDEQDREMVINRLRTVDESWSLTELTEALTFHSLIVSRGNWADKTDSFILENSLHLRAIFIIRERLKLPPDQLDETDVRAMYESWGWIGNHSYGRDAGGISARLKALIIQYDNAAHVAQMHIKGDMNFHGDVHGHNQQFNAGGGNQQNNRTVKTAMIEYDNKLLNDMDLLSPAIKEYGVSRVMNAVLNFDSDFIDQIALARDEDMLYAGIISFEDYTE